MIQLSSLLPILCNVTLLTKPALLNINEFNIAAELGDYDPVVHTAAFVSEFRFVPDQTEEMEIKIIEEYKKCRYINAVH